MLAAAHEWLQQRGALERDVYRDVYKVHNVWPGSVRAGCAAAIATASRERTRSVELEASAHEPPLAVECRSTPGSIAPANGLLMKTVSVERVRASESEDERRRNVQERWGVHVDVYVYSERCICAATCFPIDSHFAQLLEQGDCRTFVVPLLYLFTPLNTKRPPIEGDNKCYCPLLANCATSSRSTS